MKDLHRPATIQGMTRGAKIWITLSLLVGAGIGAASVAFIDIPSSSRPAASSPTLTLDQSPTPSAPAAIPMTFTTAQSLIDTLDAHGLSCGTAVEITLEPRLAPSMADCGPSVVVAVYRSYEDALDGYQQLIAINKQIGKSAHVALGANWTVSGDADYAKKVAIIFGVMYFASEL